MAEMKEGGFMANKGKRFAAPCLCSTHGYNQCREITISPAAHKVFLDGTEITLAHKEYELLHLFMSNPEQIFLRNNS